MMIQSENTDVSLWRIMTNNLFCHLVWGTYTVKVVHVLLYRKLSDVGVCTGKREKNRAREIKCVIYKIWSTLRSSVPFHSTISYHRAPVYCISTLAHISNFQILKHSFLPDSWGALWNGVLLWSLLAASAATRRAFLSAEDEGVVYHIKPGPPLSAL